MVKKALQTGAVVLAAALLLAACDKDSIGTVYYIVAAVLGSVFVAWITSKYMKKYKVAMHEVAAKYNGTIKSFGGGAGGDIEMEGAHAGHRFVFTAKAEGNGSRLMLRVHGRPTPPPERVFLADKAWWKESAASFGLDRNLGQAYGDYVFVSEPPQAAAALLNKPDMQAHLEALRRSVALSLFIGPHFVDYHLIFKGQKIHSQPKYYTAEVMSWWIEAMVAFMQVLEQPGA